MQRCKNYTFGQIYNLIIRWMHWGQLCFAFAFNTICIVYLTLYIFQYTNGKTKFKKDQSSFLSVYNTNTCSRIIVMLKGAFIVWRQECYHLKIDASSRAKRLQPAVGRAMNSGPKEVVGAQHSSKRKPDKPAG